LPVPKLLLKSGVKTYRGDLIDIANLKEFPLHKEDNWEVINLNTSTLVEEEIPNQKKTPFGTAMIVSNTSPLSNKHIWVVGDSFSVTLRQFLNATFKEIRYLGHQADLLINLPEEIVRATQKPDLILIERVERSF
jgi:hypothetical protein